MAKPQNDEDKFFNEKLEALEGPVPEHLRQDIVKERRRIKKDRNKARRNREKRELREQM